MKCFSEIILLLFKVKVITLDRALLLFCELGAIPVSCLKRCVLHPHLLQELMEILQK